MYFHVYVSYIRICPGMKPFQLETILRLVSWLSCQSCRYFHEGSNLQRYIIILFNPGKAQEIDTSPGVQVDLYT